MDPRDLSLLPTLDALLQAGSVSGAAERLGLSTPAVSHALARLRQELGDEVLVRAGRGMVLTPRALALRDRSPGPSSAPSPSSPPTTPCWCWARPWTAG